ncbi:MAG: hypothetical protein M1608_00585 [Candidatus Omnitrophica bacterium]|nr:hypothetical protein [Candidatus Omnitrophota bacterium]
MAWTPVGGQEQGGCPLKIETSIFDSMRLFYYLIFGACIATSIGATTIQQDFAHDPAMDGWRVFGDPSLFQWNVTNEYLEVTWDSSRANSYFYHPLGTVLAKEDDFKLEFDLVLRQVTVGLTPGKPYAFELAIGFMNHQDAFRGDFRRGTGTGSPNLAEFDYFPDSGYGATVWPAVVSTNGMFNYSGSTDYTIVELPLDEKLHVQMIYLASEQTVTTVITRQGQSIGPINPVHLSTAFTDYRVDSLAVSSYTDDRATGSVFAKGEVDNFIVTVPDPPVSNLALSVTNSCRQVQFAGKSGWLYILEGSTNLATWTPLVEHASSTNHLLTLVDTNAPYNPGYYRIRAERP